MKLNITRNRNNANIVHHTYLTNKVEVVVEGKRKMERLIKALGLVEKYYQTVLEWLVK